MTSHWKGCGLRQLRFSCFLFSLVALCFAQVGYGQQLAFKLRSHQGVDVELEEKKHAATVVCFLGTECPMARSYASTLNRLQRNYKDQGVRVIGVMSNRQDSIDDVAAYADSLSVEFELAIDQKNSVANQFGATRTPEAFLLDEELKLRYHGRIDDQYAPGVVSAKARREDLRIALKELLQGKPISIRETKALGCLIGKIRIDAPADVTGAPTFAKEVFEVLKRNCIECHRSGEIGPFSMERYDEVVGWADTMLETIEDRRMPPWHAEPGVHQFVNARHMPETDKQVLRDWIDAGCPTGDLNELPKLEARNDGWQFQPEEVFEMRGEPYLVPRDGVVDYQYFVVDPGFTEDKWVSAAQVVPGARDVVHHAIVFIRPPDGTQFLGVGWLAAYVPGQRAAELPPGRARKIPAGSKLVFQMHYTPNGTPRGDVSQIGLKYVEESEVSHSVYTAIAINQDFDIPPNATDHQVAARTRWLPQEGELLAATPHMHYRGKACALVRKRPGSANDSDGTDDEPAPGELPAAEDVLLNVPQYDFNWQHTYQFAKPIPLSEIGSLRFDVVFDNSEANPFNPDASEWVYWGDQTWEEMAVAFFEVSTPRRRSKRSVVVNDAKKADQKKVAAYIKRVFDSLDANGDRQIHKSEGSTFVRHFNFNLFDRNRDGVATEEEIRKVAERLYR